MVAGDFQGRGAQAGFIAVLPVECLDGVALALGPAGVHAVEHLRPIARFRAARTGGNHEETRGKVARLVEQRQQFVGTDVSFQALRVGDRLAGEIGVVVFLGERDAFVDVRHAGFQFEKRFEFFLQARFLPCFFRVMQAY